MCKLKFINQGKRWKEKEYLMLILMYLTGIYQYVRMSNPEANFPTLRRLYNPKSELQKSILNAFFLKNEFGKVLCKLRSKESILNKLDYNIGYYPIVKQVFIGYRRKENKDATTKFKRISGLLFNSRDYPNINELEKFFLTINNKNEYTLKFIRGQLYRIYIRKIITVNDYNNITKTIDNLLK